uniref:Retroviral envelope protein GP41-like domain-containing protein n=1 Tax=Equus caballus TaxID=9796 RepID=A0A9L0TFZ3_HORSE
MLNVTEGYVNCTAACVFTQCVNKTWWETIENTNKSVIIVKARSKLWMPINLTHPWSDSIAVSHLYDALQVVLHRSRRLVGLIVATILAVASVTAMAAVASLALQQEIQTADFIREWHKDSHALWQQQKDLDAQLATDVINLQHTVSWLGDQLTVLATRSILKCDWNSTQMCVTPLHFSMSEGWEKIKRSLRGHQNLTAEIMQLEQSIADTFSKELPKLTGDDLLKGLQEGNFRILCSISVKNVMGILIGTALNLNLYCFCWTTCSLFNQTNF